MPKLTKQRELKLRLFELHKRNLRHCFEWGCDLPLYEIYEDNIKRSVEKKYENISGVFEGERFRNKYDESK